MKAGHPHFMSAVAIKQAIDDLNKAYEALETGLATTAAARCRLVAMAMTDTMEKILLKRITEVQHEVSKEG